MALQSTYHNTEGWSLAKILSIVFHPLWMPMLIYMLTRWLDPYYVITARADRFVLLLLTVNIIAPAVSMLVMIRYGMLSSIELKNRNERLGPYLITIFYYLVSYFMLRWFAPELPRETFSFVLAIICSLVFSLTVNLFWKISVHMLAQGGVFGTLLALQRLHHAEVTLVAMFCVLMSGLTGYSRVKLEAHTPGQVYAGFILGLVVNYLAISNRIMI
jgi:membrane-associated phospholipid phosphatase